MAVRQGDYEKQARFSVILGIAGGVCTLAGVAFILQAFDWTNFQLVYDPRRMRAVSIAGALFVGLIGSAAGFLFGLISAGQRNNTRNHLSWTGFFLSAAVIALTLSAGVFFWLTRFALEVKQAARLGG